MKIQLEQVDIDAMMRGGGITVAPFKSYWTDFEGRLIAMASGVTKFEYMGTAADEIFDMMKKSI